MSAMKRIVSTVLSLLTVIIICACGHAPEPDVQPDPPEDQEEGREGAIHTSERSAFWALETASAKAPGWESTGMSKEGQWRTPSEKQELRDQVSQSL